MIGNAQRSIAAARAARHVLAPAVPGLIAAFTIAAAAREVGASVGMPPIVIALGIGMLFARVVNVDQVTPGVTMATRPVLRLGVALLGAQITLQQLAGLGLPAVGITLTGLVAALATGLIVGRLAGLPRGLTAIAAGAVAICGASAALAIAAVVPARDRRDEDVAAVIAGVTVVGTIAMLAYPLIGNALGFSSHAMAVFLGATLHEVAQAVGAAMAISDDVGSVATAVKLVRVACLSPVVIIIGILLRSRGVTDPAAKAPLVPAFLMSFFLLAAASSLGLMPDSLKPLLAEISRVCLLVAVAALGMKTSLRNMLGAGKGLIVTICAATLVLAVFIALLLRVSP